ncbi:LAMI_0H07624g1_1 [Lachancea mirantina]|uniref:Glutamate--cysteine ligase n=1 Tax=Lachancea mirantina TaxID=1230905 RepID=A0A1G4KFV6_9SACH|nr:LAMI_0H07624g1_1 [Lachancea mirantina]
MGLLSLGTPLPWLESRQYNEHVRDNGVQQLLYSFKAAYGRKNDIFYWGDELEFIMFKFQNHDGEGQNAVLTLESDDVLTSLNNEDISICEANDVLFHPEYGRYMIEATPASPYEGLNTEYVENNMQIRRKLVEQRLAGRGCRLAAMAVFPRMGCEDFSDIKNVWDHHNNASKSLYLPDEVTNRHARFPTLTANIRTRRGEKVNIQVPMYKDKFTPYRDDSVYKRDWFEPEDSESVLAAKPGYIYMDAMGFGMGCCCLQITLQAPDISKARYVYDSLANIATIMLAATAASPFFKGWLADQDVRWNVISSAVDDRTPYERGVAPLLPQSNNGHGSSIKANPQRIPKSRYSVVDLFLGGNEFFDRSFNDTDVPLNEKVLETLQSNDIFELDYDLARHFSHLFIRDPLVIFQERINQDNLTSTDHFENIQSTNWQSLRFKPPNQKATPDQKDAPGWRVEFRTMELQMTEFENAAYSCFIHIITECLLTFSHEINPYMPMSKIWENMEIAHRRDAVLEQQFHWKDDLHGGRTSLSNMDHVFHNVKSGLFPQFIDRLLKYKSMVTESWRELVKSKDSSNVRLFYYLKLISDRATGNLPTAAKFLRQYVLSHPDYSQDSRVTKEINYDTLKVADRITHLDDSNGELTKFFGGEIANYIKSCTK